MAGLPPAQAMGQRQDVRQLQRSVDLAVRGEDLLEQGRAGARQAQDEDRVRRLAAGPCMACEQFGRAPLGLRLEFGGHLVGVIARLLALERVAAVVEAERLFVLAAVFVSLAQREGEVNAIHEGDVGPLHCPAHRGQFGIGEAVGLEIGERVPGVALIGLCRAGGAIGGDGVVLFADRLERVPLGGQRRRIAGNLLQHRIEQGEGAVVIPGLHALDGEL